APSRRLGTVMLSVPLLPTVPIVAMWALRLPLQPAWRCTAWAMARSPDTTTVTVAEPPIMVTVTEPLPPSAKVRTSGGGACGADAGGAGLGGGGDASTVGGAEAGGRGEAGLAWVAWPPAELVWSPGPAADLAACGTPLQAASESPTSAPTRSP